jgi:hypothetical protein
LPSENTGIATENLPHSQRAKSQNVKQAKKEEKHELMLKISKK